MTSPQDFATPAAAVAPAPARPWLPPESPLSMPVQSLAEGRLANPVLPTTPWRMGLRRLWVVGGTALLTVLATYQIWWLLRGDGISVLEGVLLVLFVLLFAWIALAFTGAVAGFVRIVGRWPMRLGIDPAAPLPVPGTRTALLMPVYNEDPARVLAGLQAILESLRDTGAGEAFDAFVLSDTRKPEIAAQEEAGVAALRERLPWATVYYRRRDDNAERKAGNVAEWVRRFGGAYAQMLILDADSVMSGDTIVRLAVAMETHPDVGLVQTLPLIVSGHTIFARMQQFAGRVYGPVIAQGVAWWHGAESNYWGHNAMIRTVAFAAQAGLPELRGGRPFGGTVLSHDFVEAALMRRGGWALHMIPSLEGSYEEGPPSLTDMLVRDRRWCQGNLQHAAVLPARGLHWISRMHLCIGIGHYFTAPMWAMLMLVGVAIPLQQAGIDGGGSPLAYWRAVDPQRFLWVFALTMTLLFTPKLLGTLATLQDRQARRDCGGGLRVVAGMLLETVLAALMAPVTMYLQSRGVAEVLAGRDSGWDAQRRDDGTLPLSALARRYGGLTVFGAAAGVVAYVVSPALAAWMSPVIAGLVLSIPVVALTAARAPGEWLYRTGIFRTQEESRTPEVLVRAEALRGHTH